VRHDIYGSSEAGMKYSEYCCGELNVLDVSSVWMRIMVTLYLCTSPQHDND